MLHLIKSGVYQNGKTEFLFHNFRKPQTFPAMNRKPILLFWLFFFGYTITAQEPKLILPIGHSLGVANAEFSPDGKKIVSSSLDNTIKVWETATGLLLANLEGHSDTVTYATFSPDGRKIATACEDGTAKIWDASKAILLVDINGHTDKVFYAEFSPDGKKIVTASADQTAKVWDTETGKLLADLKGHILEVWAARFSPDGKKIITASNDSTAKIWDAITGKLLSDLRGHTLYVSVAVFSPDGKLAITGSVDSTAKIWDVHTGNLLYNLKGHKDAIGFASFSPNGKKVLTGSDDGFARVWNIKTGESLFSMEGKVRTQVDKFAYFYPDIITGAQYSPDGKKIMTVYLDSSVKIWDAVSGKLLKKIKKDYVYVNSASFSPDSKKIALSYAYGNIEIRDINTGDLLNNLKGNANYFQGVYLNSDGEKLLISNERGPAKIIDLMNASLVTTFPEKNAVPPGLYAKYSPDGKKVLTYFNDNIARVYNAITGSLLFELKSGFRSGLFADFSPDGKIIYTSGGGDSIVRFWDASHGKLIHSLKRNNPQSGIQYSPDQKRILITNQFEGIISLYDTQTWQLIVEKKVHQKFMHRAEYSPDGKKIITVSDDSTAKVWNAENADSLFVLKNEGRRIQFAKFSPDGKRLFLRFTEKIKMSVVTKIWDAETGKYINELNHYGSEPEFFNAHVWFTKDGSKIFYGMADRSVKFWDVNTGKLVNDFKNLKESIHTQTKGITPDGKQFIVCSDEGTISFYAIETGELMRQLSGHKFRISGVQFSPDMTKIITYSFDHTLKLWDANTGNLLYTFIAINDDDYLVLDKDNHFDGTEAARKLLYFTCGTEVIELDQLKDQLWVPNLAERILNGETINAAKLSDLNICNLTPLVDTVEQTASQYRFQITPRLGGLGTSIVYVNGIEVKRYTPQQLIKQKDGYQLAVDKKELQKFFIVGKENSITVKSITAKNSISSRSVSINEKGNEKNAALPNLYAVVVGVSDYKGEELDLSFAAKDAVDIANAIDASAKKLLNTDDKEHVFIYKLHTSAGRDKFPEKNSIKQVFTEIAAKAQPNDILLIFFAGHGVMESEKNQFYFLTADASNATVSGALKNVGISTDELSEWIKPQVMKAQKRILIFDACNSGQALNEIISFNNDAKNMLASRGDESGKQKKAIEKLNEKSGMFILSASASDQKAYEIGKYNQGALTYSLLKAIKEQPDILEDRQYLNISRWFNAAEKTVGELARETGTRQQPQIVSTSNFNIGIVDDDVRNNIVLPFEKSMFTRSDFRNTETTIDNLKLRSIVDKELIDLSQQANASLIYSPEYEGQNIYQLSGSYKVSGNEIAVTIIITQGGTEIKTKFEVTGKMENLSQLSTAIISAVKKWVESNK
jgi:WD40 repeat protein/uncharacterized caspase-like protein